MTALTLQSVSRAFGAVHAVDGVSFDVNSGELISVLGPSGCGKSTVLNLVAGFVRPDQGIVSLDGQSINDVPPNRRRIGIVFQSYALFPHLTAFENVAFGLRMRGVSNRVTEREVASALDMVRMGGFRQRYPRQMSGGEQQRIALARALVIKPSVLLLDEPLAALDKQIRQSMQLELLEVQRATGVTALFVTHDQEEAMALSNRIVVMRSGKVEQIGTPSQIYHQPANKFVASFIGRSNFLDAEIVGSRGETVEARLANGAIVTANAQGFAPRDKVTLALRPENISLKLNGEADRTSKLVGTVVTALDLGPVSQVVVEVSGVGRLEVSLPGPPGARGTGPVASGTAAGLEWGPENMTVLKS